MPELRGRAFEIYRIVWAILFAACAIASTLGLWNGEHQEREAALVYYRLGLSAWSRDVSGIHVMPLSAQAMRAGIRPNDRLVQAGARKIDPADSWNSADVLQRLSLPAGRDVSIKTAASDEAPRTFRLTANDANIVADFRGSGLSFDLKRDIVSAVALLGGLVQLAAALVLFIRRPHDPVVALISLGMIIGLSFSTADSDSNGLVAALPVLRTLPAGMVTLYTHVTSGLNVSLLLAGMLFFPSGTAERRWMIWALIPLAAYTVLSIVNVFDLLLSVTGLLAVALVALALWQQFRDASAARERQQIKWIVIGFVAALVCGVVSTLGGLVQESFDLSSAQAPWVSLIAQSLAFLVQAFVALGLLISLLRFRLYDADAFISRSVAYAVLTLLLGAVFAGSEKVIEKIGEDFFGGAAGASAAGIAAAVAVVVIAPLHDRIRGWMEMRFQRTLQNSRVDCPGSSQNFARWSTSIPCSAWCSSKSNRQCMRPGRQRWSRAVPHSCAIRQAKCFRNGKRGGSRSLKRRLIGMTPTRFSRCASPCPSKALKSSVGYCSALARMERSTARMNARRWPR